MSTIKFSDGQTVESDQILRVSVLEQEDKLQVVTAEGPIYIQGASVQADLMLLKDAKHNERLYFMIHEK